MIKNNDPAYNVVMIYLITYLTYYNNGYSILARSTPPRD